MQISQMALLCCRVLTSNLIRMHLLNSRWNFALSRTDLRQKLYLNSHSWQARLPDHVFDIGFKAAQDKGLQDGKLASTSLRMLSERYLCIKHGRVQVRLELFGEWQQSVLSRVSGIPIIAAAKAIHAHQSGHVTADGRMQASIGNALPDALPCITPIDGAVEDYISREGLHESHLHLNGSTFAEQCWLRALENPDREVKKFSNLWQNAKRGSASDKVKELASLNDSDFSPIRFRRDLILARELRSWLVYFVAQPETDDSIFPLCISDLGNSRGKKSAPLRSRIIDLQHGAAGATMLEELTWLTKLLAMHNLPHRMDRMLHLYLLIQHQYRALMVQGEEFYGFDQFQKLTHTELRTVAEKSYLQRFVDMHGVNPTFSQSNYLEGRFAPKSKSSENVILLNNILSDFAVYLQINSERPIGFDKRSLRSTLSALDLICRNSNILWPKRQQLALVAHFIKEDWDFKKGGPYRHYQLRRKLDKQMAQLRKTLGDYPRLHRWVRGVDGAANELHAAPEVFASVFRQALRIGLGHRSFHVGEDFPHLLTGIRNIFEAIEFLDLRDGARIGHGTAVGINPSLWLSRMPSSLHLRCGDRLLDLLAAWQLLRASSVDASIAYKIELEVNRLVQQIFRREVSISLFERAMKMRDLHIGFVSDACSYSEWTWKHVSFADGFREEAKLVMQAKEQDYDAFSLLWEWQSNMAVWSRSETLMQVETEDDIFNNEIYIRLQQSLMKHIFARKIVIETLPSSNVRISQYERFEEHHILRWMGIPGYAYEGDVPIMVSLGSDDPGIFSGNLKGEFYQIYSAMRNIGISDAEALRHVSIINERGRQYRFHDLSL
ncbi:hypothetical protein [Comamonas sp. MYb69]|uniref:hypothetical protein n=1 Tax=Comamonas sp. MYb69 TaxID=1848650 RepID=UPI0030DA04A8